MSLASDPYRRHNDITHSHLSPVIFFFLTFHSLSIPSSAKIKKLGCRSCIVGASGLPNSQFLCLWFGKSLNFLVLSIYRGMAETANGLSIYY